MKNLSKNLICLFILAFTLVSCRRDNDPNVQTPRGYWTIGSTNYSEISFRSFDDPGKAFILYGYTTANPWVSGDPWPNSIAIGFHQRPAPGRYEILSTFDYGSVPADKATITLTESSGNFEGKSLAVGNYLTVSQLPNGKIQIDIPLTNAQKWPTDNYSPATTQTTTVIGKIIEM